MHKPRGSLEVLVYLKRAPQMDSCIRHRLSTIKARVMWCIMVRHRIICENFNISHSSEEF